MDEKTPFTLEEAHLHFAKTLNGETWSLLDKESRVQPGDERMLAAAFASHYHWLHAGGEVHRQRGKGVSSSLIRPFLERAEAENVIAYTDTITRSNVPLYEHFGFQCVEESAVSGTGITVWALRRPVQ